MLGLSFRVLHLQIELCQNGMVTQKYFLVKKKKKENENSHGSMKPRNYVKKLDEFISGNKRLNYCGKRVNYDGGYSGLAKRET